MTWNEARRQLRKGIEQNGDLIMQMTGGRGPMPPAYIDPSHLNNPKYSVVQRTMIVQMLSYDAVKDCFSRSLNELLSGIDDPDHLVRTVIADACGACGYAPAIPPLIRKLKESSDSVEMERLAFALTAMGESAVRELTNLLLDLYHLEGDQVGKNIIWQPAVGALVEMGPDVVDWLLKFFLDEHPDRWFMAYIICRDNFGRDFVLQKLREMFEINRSNQMLMSRISHVIRSS